MKKKLQSGFSFIELLIVLTIMGILFSVSGINLLGAYNSNSLGVAVTTLQADIKQQQLKAMVGDTEGQGAQDSYGIYFQTDNYILFKGATYSASDPLNFSVDLDDSLQFSSLLIPDSQIIFTKGSGEVTNYNPSYDNVTLLNVNTEDTKTVRINRYGTVINIY